jgi:hypothetical protein
VCVCVCNALILRSGNVNFMDRGISGGMAQSLQNCSYID